MTQQEQIQTLLQLLMSGGMGGSFQGLSNPALSQLLNSASSQLNGGLPNPVLSQLRTLGPRFQSGQSGLDPEAGATPPPYRGKPVFGKPTPEDEVRHKTLNKYLSDPNVDLNNPKVQNLLEVLGLTDASGLPMLRHIDLNDYFRGRGELKTKFRRGVDPDTGETYQQRLFNTATKGMENPPPDEGDSVGTGYGEIPAGAIPVDRGAFMYEPEKKEKKSEARQVIDPIYERMRNRILNDYFNGLLRLPDPMEDEEPSKGTAPISMYFQPIAQLIHTMANGGM
jgi:hypothetical protein